MEWRERDGRLTEVGRSRRALHDEVRRDGPGEPTEIERRREPAVVGALEAESSL